MSWESSARPAIDLHFETDSAGANDLVPSPEAFLAATVLSAIHHGETRLLVEGSLCPRLAEGVQTAAALLQGWFGPPREAVAIEATQGFRALVPRSPPSSALYFTGGVDSTHLLRTNRRNYPAGHPASFTHAISVDGQLRAESKDSPWTARALGSLAKSAEANGLTLIRVKTNLWDLDPDLAFVTRESLSSGLAAAAHLFPGLWSSVSLASGLSVSEEFPRGTHPLLDPLYSSSGVSVRHDPLTSTRFERLRELADGGWADDLIVCMAFPGPPHLNCGECEKCLRTMTALIAVGRLADARTFRHREVTAGMIGAITLGVTEIVYWEAMLEPLAERNRGDLVQAVEAKVTEARQLERWQAHAGWKGGLRRLDQKLLGGKLLSLRKRLG